MPLAFAQAQAQAHFSGSDSDFKRTCLAPAHCRTHSRFLW